MQFVLEILKYLFWSYTLYAVLPVITIWINVSNLHLYIIFPTNTIITVSQIITGYPIIEQMTALCGYCMYGHLFTQIKL